MYIFDDIERHNHHPATHNEDEFSFLNRSARPAAERVRNLIEAWAAREPRQERERFRARFRAEFEAVFFELFLHELLRKLGCSVTAHPEVDSSVPTRPDFLARFPSGQEVIIEARLATDRSDAERARRARLGTLYDQINRVHSPNFFLHLNDVPELGPAQPPAWELRAFIEAKISELDPDRVLADIQERGSRAAPSWIYQKGDFRLKFSVWPKSPATRDKPGSTPIGIYPSEFGWDRGGEILKKAVLKKVSKYGDLDRPYVIAVNAIGLWGADRIREMEALFGPEEVHWSIDTSDVEVRRKPDGVWIGPRGPQRRHVSAVLFTRVFPWNLPTAPLCLYHNPFAARPCVDLPWQIPEAVPNEGIVEWGEGRMPGELLGLSATWPGQLFDR
jgi:hypothetical protein